MTCRYTLYGAEISYFTGKVRAYLRWKGLPHEEVPADARVYREVILPRVGFPVIPVVVTETGETLQDSTEIIEVLEQRHPCEPVSPGTPVQRLVSLLLELYGDEWLVIPAMHYRWHHNREWAMRGFGELSAPGASPDEQYRIGTKLAGPFAQAAVLLGAEPGMHAAIEASYEALLRELDLHFSQQPYLLGTQPSIGDFGLVGPLYAHQYRDPASGDLMKRLAPEVVSWVQRMQTPRTPASGEFLPGDQIPGTLLPVLRRMMREQMPVLQETARRASNWMGEHPGAALPRTLGMHGYELEGCRGQRVVRPYSLWMLQRARDAYLALPPPDRERAQALLTAVGGEAFMQFGDPPRLRRHGLSVAPAWP